MSCLTLVRVVLWGVGVLSVACVELSEEFNKHNKMVAIVNFPCRMPQPRVFYLQELVNATEAELKRIQPKWTILHRCTATGCCDDEEKRCQPSGIEDLNVTFRNLTEKMSYFQIPVTNHTSCACLSTDNSGKKNIK